jgi:hypothetical protein
VFVADDVGVAVAEVLETAPREDFLTLMITVLSGEWILAVD